MSDTTTTTTTTRDRCGFAFPGTYGHECGKPATLVGAFASDLTTDGVYWARRCAACAAIRGGENRGGTAWQPLDPARHVNRWH